jgi:penicillin-binding protein 1A
VFANGGHRIQPWFIERIVDPQGKVVFEATPRRVAPECETPLAANATQAVAAPAEALPSTVALPSDCDLPATQIAPRVISAQNAWLMTDMLREVITRGTGRRALALGRRDIAGKTGTTNEARDTWFNGYNAALVASVWVGFDQSKPLGEGEEGSRTAVPIWTDFMAKALQGVPDASWPSPGGLVQVRISPVTGELASADDPSAIFETFMADRLPAGSVASESPSDPARRPSEPASSEPIF